MYAHFAEEFATELINVQSDTELSDALAEVSRRLGFDHFALSLELRSGSREAPGLLLHDYPEEWARVYVAFDLAGQDPVRRACDKSFIGFAWEMLEEIIPLTRGDRQMLAVGKECGIGDGYTVPRHLPGLARGTCTFVVCPDRDLPRCRFALAEIVGTLALSCALALGPSRREETVPPAQRSPARVSCVDRARQDGRRDRYHPRYRHRDRHPASQDGPRTLSGSLQASARRRRAFRRADRLCRHHPLARRGLNSGPGDRRLPRILESLPSPVLGMSFSVRMDHVLPVFHLQATTMQNRTSPDDLLLRTMFEARKRVFVDLLKWDVPVIEGAYEIDQFDTPEAIYVILTDVEGGHRASARLLRTDREHILGELFPELCDGPVPVRDDFREITRFCIEPTLSRSQRRAARDELVTALAEHALANAIAGYTAVATQSWYRQIAGFGWRCRALGGGCRIGADDLVALQIDIDRDTPADLARGGIYRQASCRIASQALEVAA